MSVVTSGPQVVEGLHGQPYGRPLERLKETVAVIRLALAGEKIEYHGNQIELPLPPEQGTGLGKALRIGQPPRPHIPIHLATLGPQALRFAGAAADGWVVNGARTDRRADPSATRPATRSMPSLKAPSTTTPTPAAPSATRD